MIDCLESCETEGNTPAIENLIRKSLASNPEMADGQIPFQVMEKIQIEWARLDPLLDLRLDLNCPECQYHFEEPFTISEFFLNEMDMRMHNLEQEINWIALHYHWTESEILRLPIWKRKRYVELINNAIYSGRDK